jgi:glycosyltransferase involved in cell wall biosynthesis
MGRLSKLPKSNKKGWPWDEEFELSNYNTSEYWPRITIVTPSFNQGIFLEETIRSILLQNYPSLEYIIMDGGSSDESVNIINTYSKWIDFWVSEKDNGQSDALVKGFKKSTGILLNWINSDDILCKGGLYHIAQNYIINNQAEFIYGKNLIIDKNSNNLSVFQHPKDNLKLRYIYEMPYGQQACFFSSDIYKKVGGIHPGLRFSMDYELYVKMHLFGAKTLQIDNEIGAIRIHESTKTSNLENVMRQENGNVFRTFLLSLGDIKNSDFFGKLGFKVYENYNIHIQLSKKEKKRIVELFINKIIWYYYENDKKTASILAKKLLTLNFKNLLNKQILKIYKDGFY